MFMFTDRELVKALSLNFIRVYTKVIGSNILTTSIIFYVNTISYIELINVFYLYYFIASRTNMIIKNNQIDFMFLNYCIKSNQIDFMFMNYHLQGGPVMSNLHEVQTVDNLPPEVLPDTTTEPEVSIQRK